MPFYFPFEAICFLHPKHGNSTSEYVMLTFDGVTYELPKRQCDNPPPEIQPIFVSRDCVASEFNFTFHTTNEVDSEVRVLVQFYQVLADP